MKASFYANPIVDTPTLDARLVQRYPSYCRPNLWPREALPPLEPAFKRLGRLIVQVRRFVHQLRTVIEEIISQVALVGNVEWFLY